ncbi:MAG: peroxide stress protein YaaA [Myxococcota bacterium]
MLALLSPAKTLDLDPPDPKLPFTEPGLLAEAKSIHQVMKKMSVADLAALMDLSQNLAELNRERFQDWKIEHAPGEAKQAILTFAGDVYLGLEAGSLKKKDLEWSQQHVGILSGLYGLLRPLDLIRPYRLEMGSKVATRRGKDLYAFWGDKIAKTIVQRLDGERQRSVVNLASNEYWKAVAQPVLAKAGIPILNVAFKEIRDGEAVTYALFAKKARGMMARHIITARVDAPAGLKDFAAADYRFDAERSSDDTWVFTRPFRKMAMASGDD